MQLGFIGLGAMGLPMTRHLLQAGHQVTVASRSPDPVGRAVALGAIAGDSPAAVARASDLVILCVPSSPQVAEVVDAMLPVLGAGKVVVDCSTIDPEVERDQHQRVTATGAGFLDAPLSGGTAGAERGTLTLMVGGDAATLETARPALDPFAGLIVHVGGPGMGQVVKLCNNLIYAAQMLATSEATALARTAGVDLDKLLEVLEHSTGDCVAVRTRLPAPGFMTDLMAKDLDLALAYAAGAGVPLATTIPAREALAAASEAGYGREDFSSMAKVVYARSGLDVRPE
jgi:3-hydroxyisobutyrate dehydrogenase-like beta-hydroxyacid dehydrogenase